MSATSRLFSLEGKQAVITGGTRGIGLAIARAFCEAGARTTISSRSNASCQQAKEDLAAEGLAIDALACDVTDRAAIDQLFLRQQKLDVLVHCAGIASAEFAQNSSYEERARLLDVHYHAGIECAKRAYGLMKGRGGSIILVGSIWGLGGASGTLAYGAAKAALMHAVKVLAIEWSRDAIRVNALVPGFVETDMTHDVPESAREKMLGRIPLRRAARPEEMAGPALFLATDAASYVTGHALIVDGGERAR